jgi:hypothetical protein
VACWLHRVLLGGAKGSPTWRYLQRSLPILLHWLAWCPGTGELIRIGKDQILGMGDKAMLSDELIAFLNQQGIYFLSQASRDARQDAMGQTWIKSAELGIEGDLATEWKNLQEYAYRSGGVVEKKTRYTHVDRWGHYRKDLGKKHI